MPQIQKLIRKPRLDYYETHLSLINCILPHKKITTKQGDTTTRLTPMEVKILASFMSLDGDIAQHRFGTTAKKLVMEELSLKPQGLSNHMTMLKIKGYLLETEKGLDIYPILLPEKEEQHYAFKLISEN